MDKYVGINFNFELQYLMEDINKNTQTDDFILAFDTNNFIDSLF